MNTYLKDITIVLISYKSLKKIRKFIKKIPPITPVLIIENSFDKKIKKIYKNKKKIKVIINRNNGYGSSINLASKKIKTKYFLVSNPDVMGINKNSLINFYKYANTLKKKFSVIGPHFKNASKKGHFQTSLKYDIKKIHNVHGSVMFFNKFFFKKVGLFDPNFFMYWEETDYTKRALKQGFFAYQLNKVKVSHEKGSSVEVKTKKDKENLNYLYTWHFIWSKFYYFNKHYGKIFSLIYFFPILTRIIFRMLLYKFTNNNKFYKYLYRWNGLVNSILGNKSFMRLENITLITDLAK